MRRGAAPTPCPSAPLRRTTFKETFFPVGIHSMMQQALADGRLALVPIPDSPNGGY